MWLRSTISCGALTPAWDFRLHFVDPVQQLDVELWIDPDVAVHLLPVLQQAGKDLADVVDGEGVVRAVVRHRTLQAGPRAVPHLAFRVAVAAEQHVLPLFPMRAEHGDGGGLREVGQVVEVAVRPEAVEDVAVALAFLRSGDHRHTVAHELHQVLPAPVKNGWIDQCSSSDTVSAVKVLWTSSKMSCTPTRTYSWTSIRSHSVPSSPAPRVGLRDGHHVPRDLGGVGAELIDCEPLVIQQSHQEPPAPIGERLHPQRQFVIVPGQQQPELTLTAVQTLHRFRQQLLQLLLQRRHGLQRRFQSPR